MPRFVRHFEKITGILEGRTVAEDSQFREKHISKQILISILLMTKKSTFHFSAIKKKVTVIILKRSLKTLC